MSKAQEISGKIIEILPPQSGTGAKGQWTKQVFVIETADQYPKKIAFMAWNDKCDLIPLKGTQVTVFYNPESRKYNDKWYTDLSVWKIEAEGKAKEPVKAGLDITSPEDDDLPF